MSIKNTFVVAFLWICCSAFTTAVQQFTASYQGVDVRLDWSVGQEQGIEAFELFRRKNEAEDFRRIATIPAAGRLSYSFLDDDLYKNQGGHQVQYRLTVRRNDGTVQHFFTHIQHNPTTVQRSWGSIKAMFK